jgi:hypothetical protein
MQAPLPRVSAQTDIAATSPSHAPPLDVCARSGGRRVDFMRGHHAMWRCIYPRRPVSSGASDNIAFAAFTGDLIIPAGGRLGWFRALRFVG